MGPAIETANVFINTCDFMKFNRFLFEDLPSIVIDFINAAKHIDDKLIEVFVLFVVKKRLEAIVAVIFVYGKTIVDLSYFIAIVSEASYDIVFLFYFEFDVCEDGEHLVVILFKRVLVK